MKKNFLLYFLIASLLLVVGCVEERAVNQEEINFYYPNGLPALTVAKLVKDNPILDESISINYEMQKTPDLLVTKILKEEADIAIVPSNLAAQAFNKGIPYKIVATASWGTIYLAGTEEVKSFEDLKGKEIHSFGKGLTPDLVLRFVLSKNGIDPEEDVKITYLNSAADLGPLFISGKASLAVLAEPLAANMLIKKEDANIIFDLNKEWGKITGSDKGYPQASLIIKSDLIDKNKDFVENLLKEYEKSRVWTKKNPEKLGEYAEELEISIEKETIIEAMKRIDMDYFNIEESQEEYNDYYKALLEFSPDFIGGEVPDEEIYFER